MALDPLPELMVEPIVRAALLEDLGRAGDITTDAVVPAGHASKLVLAARQPGVVAGLDCARLAFCLLDASVRFAPEVADGTAVEPGTVLVQVEGPSRALFPGIRVLRRRHEANACEANACEANACDTHGMRRGCHSPDRPAMPS